MIPNRIDRVESDCSVPDLAFARLVLMYFVTHVFADSTNPLHIPFAHAFSCISLAKRRKGSRKAMSFTNPNPNPNLDLLVLQLGGAAKSITQSHIVRISGRWFQ